MASRVPLPKYSVLPQRILFHRDHPADPQVILQIPNEDETDSETYRLDLERGEDLAWLEGLQRSRELRDLLTMEQHVSYAPATGISEAIADLDTPNEMELAIAEARAASRPEPVLEKLMRSREAVNRPAPLMSRFRQFLLGPRFGGARLR